MKINKNRIAVIIGKNGETKKEVEEALGVTINLDSETGEFDIIPNVNHQKYEPLSPYTAQKILTAINRGFNPTKAMKLIEDDYDLEVINLVKILGKSEKKLKRMKGRIIGRNGEMRKAIEHFAQTKLSVYGKTVSIITDYENLIIVRKAINMILSGLPHHLVIKYLEDQFNQKKKEAFRQLYKPEF